MFKILLQTGVMVLFFLSHLKSAKSESNVPTLTVKIETVETQVNISTFDVSDTHVLVDRGNSVQFYCEGDDNLEWKYGEEGQETDR
jgi:hypothetical protein